MGNLDNVKNALEVNKKVYEAVHENIKPGMSEQDIYDLAKKVIDDAKKAVPLAKALIAGGLPCAEVTFRTEAGEEAPEVKPVEQPKVEEPVAAPVIEEEKPVAKPTVVRTTTSIDALEAALESDKKKENFKATQKTSKRPRKIEEDEVAHEEVKVEETKPQMAIYTDEELAELEKEEEFYEDDYEDSDEDIDYDEFDEYYDDDDK